MDTWVTDYDKDGTMHTSTENNQGVIVVTRSPVYAHQLAPHEIGIMVRVGNKAIGAKMNARIFSGSGKPMSANEQAFTEAKRVAYELLQQLTTADQARQMFGVKKENC